MEEEENPPLYAEEESKRGEYESSSYVDNTENRKYLKGLKWWIIIGVLVLLYVFYTPLTYAFFDFLQGHPTLYSYYLYVESQIEGATLLGLMFFSVLGTLFFLILPSEGIVWFYFTSTDHFVFYIIFFALIGNFFGMSFNYFFGRVLGTRLLRFFFGEDKYVGYGKIVSRYGGYLLLFGNILPGPIEFISVFYGGFKFPYKRYIYLVLMGRLIKYVILFIIFFYFWEELVFYYEIFMTSVSSVVPF